MDKEQIKQIENLKTNMKDSLTVSFVTMIGGYYVYYVSKNFMMVLFWFCFMMFIWLSYIFKSIQKIEKESYDRLMKSLQKPKGRHD